jgi:fatty-acyl-CoA synthase
MQSSMMHIPMTTQMIMNHGARIHAESQIISHAKPELISTPFREVFTRSNQLASALDELGVAVGDRVATLCWNHQAHMEAYLAIPSMGAVMHTLNLRLFPEQLAYIINHAEDKVLIVDAELLYLLEPIASELSSVEQLIIVGSTETQPNMPWQTHSYEALVDSHSADFSWPELEETAAAVICYTTGTTGNPKGVVYSHKTIFVHTLASMGRDTFAIAQDDRILLLPPMFHANAWGLPYSCWFAGADLILPGPHMKTADIRSLIEQFRPTFTATVPTLINDLLQAHRESPIDMSCFRVLVSGGSPVAPVLIDKVNEVWGVPVLQGWGMTETSPLCALSIPPRGTAAEDEAGWRAMAGRPVPGMMVRICDEDDNRLAEDGNTIGELQLRGPWVTKSYYRQESSGALSVDGWLKTGDLGTINAQGYVHITDRLKDVIKSGGEWISSVELEALLLKAANIAEAAVIAIPDAKWEERPLALIKLDDPAQAADFSAIREQLKSVVAKFWVPEYWAVVAELPRTSVGKIDKKLIRSQFDTGAYEVITHRG